MTAAGVLLGADDPASLVRDAAHYDALGFNLASGHGFVRDVGGPPEVLRTPGYPALLAALYGIFGHHLAVVWIAHGLLHGATTWLLARIAHRVLGDHPRLAALVPWAYAVYPFVLFAGTRVLTEVLATFLLTLIIERLTAPEHRTTWPIVGILIAALTLARPSFMLLGPMFVVQALLRRRPLRGPVVGAVLSVALLVPWSVRTARLCGRPVLVAASGFGNALHIGTWEYRDLSSGIPDTTDFEQPGYFANEKTALAAATAPPHSPQWYLQIDGARRKLAFEQIAAHPWLFGRATAIRTVKIWVSQYLPGMPRWVGRLVGLACLLLLVLGVVGVVHRWPIGDAGWALLGPALYVIVLHAPLHAEARYTIPVRPALVLFAVIGVASVARRPRPRRRPQ